ncbi:hypothetical protein P3S68_032551 [Capsicum galapagoense]
MEEMNGILMMRRKIYEWGLEPYCNQIFNKDESPDWRPRNFYGDFLDETLQRFLRDVEEYKSLDFSIGTDVVGGVKICSYSELQQITDFRDESLIKKTLSGRLFHGTIGQGSEQRSVIVKTWDFHLPFKIGQYQLTYDFCDQIEFFTNKNAIRIQNWPSCVHSVATQGLQLSMTKSLMRILPDCCLM